jgi:CRISPR-associated protein Cas2
MRYVISYDISNNAIRRKIVKVCENFAQRVQKSVFECDIDAARLQELISKLEAARRGKKMTPSDCIRIYPLCEACHEKMKVLGYRPILATEKKVIVI